MELWIRSQDKKCLIKAKIIKFENGCLRGATDDDGWYYDLGKYKKERALEILDEIQKLLTMQRISIPAHNCNDTKHIYKDELINYVYEMPKE